jgi:hypothetical protein
MAIDVADINRDGYDDFIVVEMLSRDHRRRLTQRNVAQAAITPASQITGCPQYARNMLFLNRGDGTYAEIAQYAGVDASEWSWSPVFLDVDLDGYEDLLVPNGFERDNMNIDVQNRINQAKAGTKIVSRDQLLLRAMFPRLATPNLAFRNRGDLRFDEISQEWGFNTSTISQGACLADLDNDGDLDVALNNMNDAAGLYRNNSPAPRVAVRLKGQPPNGRAIGARIAVTGGPVPQCQEMTAGGRYLASDDTVRVFAAASPTNRLRIEVTWRTGKRSAIEPVEPNHVYEIDEARSAAAPPKAVTQPYPLFEDASLSLAHTHYEAAFDDFIRQPLLSRRLSQSGPAVCWWDVDGDRWEDLCIGSGKGGALAVFRNDHKGGFKALNERPWNEVATRDQTSVLSWKPGALLVGNANFEDGSAEGAAVVVHLAGQDQVQTQTSIAAWASSAGPMALADYDGDQSLDLFVGGRVIPGQYPAPASSRLYHQEAGKWVPDETHNTVLDKVGLVSGAVWSDLDGDGDPDLVLACEWGPLRIFRNDSGKLNSWDAPLIWPPAVPIPSPAGNRSIPNPRPPPSATLSSLTGWWNGVATGDFDGDGRLDIVAANWGQNSRYESHRHKPLRVYYGDFDEDGTADLLEAYYNPSRKDYVPLRMLDAVAKGMPFLAARFPTHQAWSETTAEEALSDRRDRVRIGEAAWLESTLFLNRGAGFEVRILPPEAQFAPAFAVCVADFDGDGHEDLFLSQNFFAVEWETSRYDAGRGLCLRGDGQGHFRAMPGDVSGIRVYGEQRGAALCDYDADGRVDLVVSQNSAETKLFRNRGGKAGLRIRLLGPEANPGGIGAWLRLKQGAQFGPVREIQAGSGCGSQNSVVQILASPSPVAQVWVRWPNGHVTTSDIPSDTHEITIGTDGRLH